MGDKTELNEFREMQMKIGFEDENILFVESDNVFTHNNGDEYSGQFSAFKDKQRIVMEGYGTYKTNDNQLYEGIWENDNLKEARKIIFSDLSEFSGFLEEMIIQGPGQYKFDNVEISGNFVHNNLLGNIFLKDPNNHIWLGNVKPYDLFILFNPLHSFWQSVLNLPQKQSTFY
ncbi:conserved hypothetical protein [Pediculus humanus corporis]|uniref:MORN repeat protein n=1 Tax=Pediculus humanus subsp. corporis TaxID=121224 RepID=E0VQE5_PEDHC|nr:uncharacterized protein Phum_PHUM376780 [Pediculus humanus corporis]EEB15601.1 conserved hypothetical protein [Pediculus humanus corporis]